MAHKHSVRDAGAHFLIDQFTRQIRNDSANKTTIVQYDHNSERLTFELPLYVDGHAMTLCDLIEIHYINISTDGDSQNHGTYEVDDIMAEGEKAVFTWMISQECTQLAGSLNFFIVFKCTENGVTVYRWGTEIFKNLPISEGMDNGEAILTEYPDILAQWKAQIFGAQDASVLAVEEAKTSALAAIEAAGEAKKQSVLDSIPDEYEALAQDVSTNAAKINQLASGIKGKLSGAVVVANDVSCVEHEMDVKILPKNFVPLGYSTKSEEIERLNDGGVAFVSDGILNDDYREIRISTTGDHKAYLEEGIYSFKLFGAPVGAFMIISGNTISYKEGVEGVFTVNQAGYMDYIIIRFAVGYSYDCTVYPMICKGETATEYTPYIDPATVTVRRCKKNIFDINAVTAFFNNKHEIQPESLAKIENGIIISNLGLYGVIIMCNPGISYLPKGEYALSVDAMSNRTAGNKQIKVVVQFEDGTYITCISHHLTNYGKWERLSGSITLENGKRVTGFAFQGNGESGDYQDLQIHFKNIQLELTEEESDYEPYNGATYTPAADGVVSGVTSLSPCMTILTDTEGVTVECEYNVDTKTYIDNKIKELMEGVTE